MKAGRHATHTAVVSPRTALGPASMHHGHEHAEGSILLSFFLRAHDGAVWHDMKSTRGTFTATVALRESPAGRYLHVADVRRHGRRHGGHVHVVVGASHYPLDTNGRGEHSLAMSVLHHHDPRREPWLLRIDAD